MSGSCIVILVISVINYGEFEAYTVNVHFHLSCNDGHSSDDIIKVNILSLVFFLQAQPSTKRAVLC